MREQEVISFLLRFQPDGHLIFMFERVIIFSLSLFFLPLPILSPSPYSFFLSRSNFILPVFLHTITLALSLFHELSPSIRSSSSLLSILCFFFFAPRGHRLVVLLPFLFLSSSCLFVSGSSISNCNPRERFVSFSLGLLIPAVT